MNSLAAPAGPTGLFKRVEAETARHRETVWSSSSLRAALLGGFFIPRTVTTQESATMPMTGAERKRSSRASIAARRQRIHDLAAAIVLCHKTGDGNIVELLDRLDRAMRQA